MIGAFIGGSLCIILFSVLVYYLSVYICKFSRASDSGAPPVLIGIRSLATETDVSFYEDFEYCSTLRVSIRETDFPPDYASIELDSVLFRDECAPPPSYAEAINYRHLTVHL